MRMLIIKRECLRYRKNMNELIFRMKRLFFNFTFLLKLDKVRHKMEEGLRLLL